MLQLGRGGSVLVAFDDNAIANGPGPDFEVFGESTGDDHILVEASPDGITWSSFAKLVESSGPLDLAELSLGRAAYVRITDPQPATATGAELDAVIALNSAVPVSDLQPLPDALARRDLTLYTGPDKNSDVVQAVPSGSILAIPGCSTVPGWANIRTEAGVAGWCEVLDLVLNVSLPACAGTQMPSSPTKVDHRLADKPPPKATLTNRVFRAGHPAPLRSYAASST
jgi:hypothetical protein